MQLRQKIMAIVSLLSLVIPLTACGSRAASDNDLLYVFNTKGELGEILEPLVKEYGRSHKIPVKVFSPGTGSDVTEITNTEMMSNNPPSIFSTQVLTTWGPTDGNFMLDLSRSGIPELEKLANQIPEDMRLKTASGYNLGIPYTVEGYGYLVDKDVLKSLFSLDDVTNLLADLKTCDFQEFRNFTEAVNQHIHDGLAHAVNLNAHSYTTVNSKTGLAGELTGVFIESGAEMWTYADHMINIPLNAVFKNYSQAYYSEVDAIRALKKPAVKAMDVLEYNTAHAAGEKGPNLRGPSFVNSTTGSYDYALQLFADHKGLFYKQGSWIYPDLKKANPEMINRLDMIPIKMPFTQSDINVKNRTPETFNTSIPFFVPNYWVINRKTSARQQREAAQFLVWLYQSERGRRFLEDEAGFIIYNRIDKDQSSKANAMNAILLDYLKAGRTLSNPFNAAPGNWLEFVGNRLKQDYMTKRRWNVSTYSEYADTIIARWQELKDIQSS